MSLSDEQKALIREIAREVLEEHKDLEHKRNQFIDHLIKKDEERKLLVSKVKATVIGGSLLALVVWIGNMIAKFGYLVMNWFSR